MTFVLAGLTGLGVLLTASPWLWPRRERREPSRLLRPVRDRLVQAGLERVGVGMFVAVSGLLGLVGGVTAWATLPVLALAVAIGAACAALPAVVVAVRARARRRAHRVVWPDVVDHLVSAVRSGLSLPDSVIALAHTGPEETRAAFRSFADDYAASSNFSLALDDLKSRLADPVADRIVETLRMARDVGGSELPTVLRSLSGYLRQQEALRSEVEARQSWVVNAARLGVAAPWIVLVLLSTRPEAAMAYNAPAGVALIVVGVGVTVVAYRIMIGIGRLPEERRWFG
ncbi:tight adherence protein B [Diaminobutyricimonas aerilata]|uniref:Tight adherence protein B n=1 Tax=Diaminobutyricimonas aerilata TaxID=1162967 RepID=A0A2M9CHI9_9MICO|nr:type II secretion system F family protein [Diaminobutyricimonas aerilata]PJJ71386.1 tight adherence protein B [Diaminobutyricimonas aerilata]